MLMAPASDADTGSSFLASEAQADGNLLERLVDAQQGRVAVRHDGSIIAWNSGASRIFGWSAEEAIGANFIDRGLPSFEFPLGDSPTEREFIGTTKGGDSVELQIWSAAKDGESLLLITDVAEKKFLEKALLEATEREQRRIGQDLHDHLCQHLLGAAFATKALAGALDRDGSRHAPQLHELARLINDSVKQARDVSRGLHPVELDSAGLMSALQELANRVNNNSIMCKFTCEKSVLVDEPKSALNAYRIVQEVVGMAMQQTGARRIDISLSQSQESICLKVSDDGIKESELTAHPQGTAARTLQYRAQAMHGELNVTFDPRKGTYTVCTFPQDS